MCNGWIDEDDSFLAKLDRKLKQKGKGIIDKLVGISTGSTSSEKQLNVLTKFNDPKGQYLYCLNCGSVKVKQ